MFDYHRTGAQFDFKINPGRHLTKAKYYRKFRAGAFERWAETAA
jgi:hypothetical protein